MASLQGIGQRILGGYYSRAGMCVRKCITRAGEASLRFGPLLARVQAIKRRWWWTVRQLRRRERYRYGMKKLPTRHPRDAITRRCLNGDNHFIMDYVKPHFERQKPLIRYYRRMRYLPKFPGKQTRGRDFCTNLHSKPHLKEAPYWCWGFWL